MTPRLSAEKKTCRLQWAVPPPDLQLTRCTVLVWPVFGSWGRMLTLSTGLLSTKTKMMVLRFLREDFFFFINANCPVVSSNDTVNENTLLPVCQSMREQLQRE